jgi:hypothetical protein
VNYEIRDGKVVYADEGPVGVLVTERQIGQTTEPTLGDLSAALIAVYGTDYGVHNPTSISRFTDMARQAAAYRKGRVLVAGANHLVRAAYGGGTLPKRFTNILSSIDATAGDTITLRTKALEGHASLSQHALTITGRTPIELPIRDLHDAQLFRLHGLGRCIRLSHAKGTVFVSVIRFMLFGGYFASINFFRTGELARRLRALIGGKATPG